MQRRSTNKGFFTEGTDRVFEPAPIQPVFDTTRGFPETQKRSASEAFEVGPTTMKGARLMSHAQRASTPEPSVKFTIFPYGERENFEVAPGGDERRNNEMNPILRPWTFYLGPGPYTQN